MVRWLLLLLLIIPALEIGIFVWLGGAIGPWSVVGIIIFTSIIGITIAKQQGMEVWHQVQQTLNRGQVPTIQVIEGICIFIGGIFLFIPGLLTDLAGFMLVLPWTRTPFIHYIRKLSKRLINSNIIIYRK